MLSIVASIVNSSSSYQPSNTKPFFVGAFGSATFEPSFTSTGSMLLPPFVSKVTVCLFTISSQFAYIVIFSVIGVLKLNSCSNVPSSYQPANV